MGLPGHRQGIGSRCESHLSCALRSRFFRKRHQRDARGFLLAGTNKAEVGLPDYIQSNEIQCNESYISDNVIPILPTLQSDKDRLEQRVQKLKEQGLTHSLKKASGGSKKKRKNANMSEAAPSAEPILNTKPRPDAATSKPESNIKNQDTASLTSKVLAEQEERNKRRKLGANDNVKSLFSNKNGMDEKHVDFMTRGFSIPANAKR